jgi:hypothetical protein
MNTYRIYEDLRSPLGEEAAKSLARTLGPMFEELGQTVTKAEFRDLNATVGRLAEAQERTEERVGRLVEAQERTEEQVARLTEAQERTEERLTRLAEAQDRTEVQLTRLTAAQERTEQRLNQLAEEQAGLVAAQAQTEIRFAELTAAQTKTQTELAELAKVVQHLVITMDRQTTRLDGVLGRTFEMQFRDRLTSYLGRLMRRGKLLRNDEVLDAIEQNVDAGEADEILRADAIASGVIDGVASHVVVEVSVSCGVADIDRAERRAGILRKAGLTAIPLVACEVISPELLSYARDRQVRIWCNGSILESAA